MLRLLAWRRRGRLAVAGCATGYLLDNNVQSFSQPAGAAGQPTYRFERLPSQQDTLRRRSSKPWPTPALHKAGLRRDDAEPRYSVQVAGRRPAGPLALGRPLGWLGAFGVGHRRRRAWLRLPGSAIRLHGAALVPARGGRHRARTGRQPVVYETRAINDGPWIDNGAVFPAMFEAALQGFPKPAAPGRAGSTSRSAR